jgi:hypothetical protein
MQKIYLVVGCPGSGKSWVCEQLAGQFNHVPHDDHMEDGGRGYVPALVQAARHGSLPVLAETPFSVSQIVEPLQEYGLVVVPVFIVENEDVLRERYREREGKEIPKGHLTRQITYARRADELGAFCGDSEAVLEHLKEQP